MLRKQILGGGRGTGSIFFGRFLVNWSPVDNDKIANEKIAWVIDMMMIYISRSLIRVQPNLSPGLLSYTHDYTVSLTGSMQDPQPRALQQYGTPTFQCFLITFAAVELVALIWREGNTFEVYFPFPECQKLKAYEEGISMVLQDLFTNWISVKQPVFKTLKFTNDFFGSNVWIPYLACLRLRLTFEKIQELFSNSYLKNELESKALFTYHHIGLSILKCNSNLINPNIATAINLDKMLSLAHNLSACQISKEQTGWYEDIFPIEIKNVNTTWPQNTDAKWLRYIPVIDAIDPVFHF